MCKAMSCCGKCRKSSSDAMHKKGGAGVGGGGELVLNNAHQQLIMASNDSSAATLVSRRILPSFEEIQSTQDTVALLADSSLSEAETAETHEGMPCNIVLKYYVQSLVRKKKRFIQHNFMPIDCEVALSIVWIHSGFNFTTLVFLSEGYIKAGDVALSEAKGSFQPSDASGS